MKYVVFGEGAGASMEAIMQVYPRHKAFTETLIAQGVVIGIGPLTGGGSLGIFRTREAAEKFVGEDPFKLEGLVKSYVIKEWNDALIPE